MDINLRTAAGTITTIGVLFTAFVTVESRYAKAADLDRLLRGQEQKTIWDLEENIDTSESMADKLKWFKRLKEKVDTFCDDYPDEDECKPEYLIKIEEKMGE